jgi:hypothetical protein
MQDIGREKWRLSITWSLQVAQKGQIQPTSGDSSIQSALQR